MTYEPGWPLLNDFVAALAEGKTRPTLRRYERIRAHLTTFLDIADFRPSLGGEAGGLLDAERQFHASGAFWQLYGADELVICLPQFLRPPWLLDAPADARTQISVVPRLVRHVRKYRLAGDHVIGSCLPDVEAAVDAARVLLRERAEHRRPDPWARRIPARLRRADESGW